MTYPTRPNKAYDYITYQSDNPADPLPAMEVDGDYANHKTAIDQIIDFLQLFTRSDGRLANGSVRPETLSSGTLAIIGNVVFRGAWVTATAYAINDFVTQSSRTYVCLVAHTSGVFATDLAASKWMLIDNNPAQLDGNNTFTGTNTFTAATSFNAATSFSAPVTTSGGGTHTGAEDFTGAAVTVATKTLGDSTTAPATTAFVQAALARLWQSGRRQTVMGGPVDSGGLPNFLATVSGLVLSTSNVSSTAPFVVAAANGFGAIGKNDRVGFSSANVSFGTLPNSSTSYLYVDIAADGTMTGGNTTLAPVYQFGGTASNTNGQATFNIAEMVMKVGNGSVASQTWRVFVGEATTSGGNITAVVAYAYNGLYDSGFTATLPSASVNKNHNIGVKPRAVSVILECTSADAGFSVGDQIDYGRDAWFVDGAAVLRPPVAKRTPNSMTVLAGSAGISSVNVGAGTGAVLTGIKWQYKMLADRGW